MGLSFVPSVVYNAITVPFSIPMRLWDPESKGHGGEGVSGAGIPESFEIRRDELVRLKLRFTESEWAAVRTWLIWAHRNRSTAFTFYFQRSPDLPVGGVSCYLETPKLTDSIKPTRGETKGTFEIDVTLRSTTGTPINVEAYS